MLFRILDNQPKSQQFWRDFDRWNEELTRSILDSHSATYRTYPPVNVYTKDEGALVVCLVPGLSPEQLDIQVKDNLVTIQGKRHPEELAENTIVHRREITSGEFQRTLELPFRVDQNQVSASCQNGVLSIHLPRREEDKPKKIQIQKG